MKGERRVIRTAVWKNFSLTKEADEALVWAVEKLSRRDFHDFLSHSLVVRRALTAYREYLEGASSEELALEWEVVREGASVPCKG